MENKENNGSRGKIVASYIVPIVGLIFVLIEKDASETEKRNYAQAATIFIIDIILGLVSGAISALGIPFVGTIIGILPTIIFIFAIIAAVKSTDTEVYEIPAIYDFSKKLFK